MNAYFADTFYFPALLSRKDEAHQQAVAASNLMQGRAMVTTTWVSTEVADALASPAHRSETDCISFVVMKQHDIIDALTGDHHFEQAGFQALMK